MAVTKDQVLRLFEGRPGTAMKLTGVLRALKADSADRKKVQRHLSELKREGRLMLLRDRRYRLTPGAPNLVVGRLEVNPRGFGFVQPVTDGKRRKKSKDLYVSRQRMGDALNGDLVLAQAIDGRTDEKPEGRVISVIERGNHTLVGRFHRAGRKGGIVVPRDRRMTRNVYVVAPPSEEDLSDGSWVVVALREYPPPPDDLAGEVIEVLGDDLAAGIDILLVLRDYGVRVEFPDVVEDEANALSGDITEAELDGRVDYRDRMTFTIDGYDAKDYDDALSIDADPSGGYRLFVHIADVAHYVQEGGAVEAEAMSRATSVYPVDRVAPMLPERLSNELCSLRPNEDHLTITVAMTVSKSGHVSDYDIHESVIRSRYRLTYRDVQSFYDGIDNLATRRLKNIAGDLESLLDLMETLRAARLKRGALDLDLPEVEIQFDDDNAIENVVRAPRWKSHQVIEEAMILANETVARFLKEQGVPILYRVHEKPERERIAELEPVLAPLGARLSPRSRKPLAAQVQEALDAVGKVEAPHILRRVILRALMQARYDPENVGHFGLASELYTHFTSPIRRYPDLLVHRALKQLWRGLGEEEEWRETLRDALPALGQHCSERERRADAIEDEATRICSLEFMRRHLGETFHGYVSGVAGFGLFVELRRFPVQGLLHVRDLHDDHYEFDESTLNLKGRRTGRRFHIGQAVEVTVHRVDPLNQEMDLRLALLEEQHPGRGGRLYQSRRRRAW